MWISGAKSFSNFFDCLFRSFFLRNTLWLHAFHFNFFLCRRFSLGRSGCLFYWSSFLSRFSTLAQTESRLYGFGHTDRWLGQSWNRTVRLGLGLFLWNSIGIFELRLLFLLFHLFSFFFCQLTRSILQRKTWNVLFCLFLLNCFFFELSLLIIYCHWLERRVENFFSHFYFILKCFCSIWHSFACLCQISQVLIDNWLYYDFQFWSSLINTEQNIENTFSERALLWHG